MANIILKMYPNYGMGGMGTGMKIQGQMDMNLGQQERQLGGMEMNQGRM